MGCVQSSQEIEARDNSQSNQNQSQSRSQGGGQQRQDGQNRGRRLNDNQGQSSQNPQGQQSSQRRQQPQQRIPYLINQNVETIVSGKFTGEGIKKTPAYETPLSKHDLDKWRKEFWETRTSGNRVVWNCIKSACEEDHATAEALILAADLQMPQNSLTHCIDEGGVYYRVPICLINDPINYDADFQTQKLKSKKAPDEKTMTLKCRHAAKGDLIMEFSNLIAISEFKQIYINELGENGTDIEIDKIRMFAMGKELKDELFVYSYDIINESTVQVMIKQN